MRANFSRVSKENKEYLLKVFPNFSPWSVWNQLTINQRKALLDCKTKEEAKALLFTTTGSPSVGYTPHFNLPQAQLGEFMIMLTGQFRYHTESEIYDWISLSRNCGIVFAKYQLDKFYEVLFDTDKTKEQKYREICSWFN